MEQRRMDSEQTISSLHHMRSPDTDRFCPAAPVNLWPKGPAGPSGRPP